MKTTMRILAALLVFIAFSDFGFALDPSAFLKILGIEINGNKQATRDLTIVKQTLGDAKQIDSGDAAEYVGRVEYILHDQSQAIVFTTSECYEGYTIKRVDRNASPSSQTILKPSIKRISVGGVKLGMKRKDVEELFAGPATGGWKLETAKKELGTRQISYRKTIVLGKRQEFCDLIVIQLSFDSQSNLNRIDVRSGGCDDGPCRDK